MNTCRFCPDPEKSVGHYGLVKYGVRHYAHADCGLRVKGVAFLSTLTDWQCHAVFPYRAAQDHSPEAVAELVRRSEKYEDDSQKAATVRETGPRAATRMNNCSHGSPLDADCRECRADGLTP